MLKILGRKTSSNVQKVLWVADEIGLPYERSDIGGPFGGNDKPEYLKLNPNGRVPTIIEDDGWVMWESNAITRYLAARHAAGTLYPNDLRQRASAERWMDWQSNTVSPQMVLVFRGLVRTPPEKRDPKTIKAGRDGLSALMAIMDRHLADNAYMAGDRFTVGDIPLGIAAWRWFSMPIEREEYPNLKRWSDALAQRKPYQTHIMQPLE
jgi:glutathione S-transferase